MESISSLDSQQETASLPVEAGSETEATATRDPFHFHNTFAGVMAMNAAVPAVAAYLDAHRGWFVRCAQPMTAEPLSDSSYALTIGRFGAFGYEVEPRLGVELLPPEGRTYRMRTVPIPGYAPVGYEVDYRAELTLLPDGEERTRVEWTLDLGVTIQFPGFIYRLPRAMIQRTGDRLLGQIVRQVSRRLTHKVQQDFHQREERPLPR